MGAKFDVAISSVMLGRLGLQSFANQWPKFNPINEALLLYTVRFIFPFPRYSFPLFQAGYLYAHNILFGADG